MDPFATRPLGRTGVQLCPLGFGGAPIGELYEKLTEDQVETTLATAYEAGIRYYDTAPWYGHGLSEHRVGHLLRQQNRDDFVLSTKVGRVYSAPKDPRGLDTGPWAGGLPFELHFDYGYDAVMRSWEDSLQRLSLNRVDLLLIHDLDFGYHETEEGVAARFGELENGGWAALQKLKEAGSISGIGAGINALGMIPRFLERFDMDFFLVAMPYTLLNQEILETEFPACADRGVGIVIGAPYASGILATGVRDGAKYNYETAGHDIVVRVRAIESVCDAHGVSLQAAALQFPFGHDSVAAIVPGAILPEQVSANVSVMRHEIPTGFWDDLKAEGLIRGDAPTP